MLIVKTKLGLSPIDGIGLYADEDIKAGTVTWRFVAGFDQIWPDSQIMALPEPARSGLINHCYRNAATGDWVLCLDNARFMNHAAGANTRGIHADGEIEGYDVATRDIARGEELTCDYRTFDSHHSEKLGE